MKIYGINYAYTYLCIDFDFFFMIDFLRNHRTVLIAPLLAIVAPSIDVMAVPILVSYDGNRYELDTSTHTALLKYTEYSQTQAPVINIPDLVPYGLGVNAEKYPVLGIAPSVFKGFYLIPSVTFPSTLESIGDGAFQSCSALSTISLPASLQQIDSDAFNGCNLITVTCEAVTPPAMGSDVFSQNVYSSATLYVPKEACNSYKEADEWKKFAIIRYIGQVDATSIKIDQTLTTANIDTSFTLTATIGPDNVTETDVTWSSSNPAVARVSSLPTSSTISTATVECLATGTTLITATTTNGLTASCTLTVNNNAGLQDISSDEDNSILYTLSGERIKQDGRRLVPGIYILHTGKDVRKIIIR